MQYTKKWREPSIDPIKTNFPCGMKILKILGYPHAANDVFVCRAKYASQEHLSVLKIERHCDADISRECKFIEMLQDSEINVPTIITKGKINDRYYVLMKFEEGERLSVILPNIGDQYRIDTSVEYMVKFGENLSLIHNTDDINESAVERKFQRIMNGEKCKALGLEQVYAWLKDNKPKNKKLCFVHGDHHYANILWNNKKLQCTLDWELCGVGWKEFDIAWTIVLRPSQKFLKTSREITAFLKGYSKYNSFNKKQLDYCMVLAYQYFYEIAKKDSNKKDIMFIKKEFERITGESVDLT